MKHVAQLTATLITAVLVLASLTTADVVEINPTDDAYVKDTDPNANFGSSSALIVGHYPWFDPVNIHRCYLKFDLGGVPGTAVIDTAEIYLYNTWLDYPAVDVGAHYLSNDGWNEGSITWNNAPTGFNPAATDLKTINLTQWTSWDVKPDVQAALTGDGVYSVVMKEPTSDEGLDTNNVGFSSKEAGSAHPYLRIRYTLPSPGKPIEGTVDITPYFDWGAVSSYAGLAPPGNMGIWDPWHKINFYFPSDSLSPDTTVPKAWLIPGVHRATYYGPATMLIASNPIVTVPDRSSRPCTLKVEIPGSLLIDEATDLNVIQISSGESKTISMTYFIQPVETMVLLANCDGGVLSPGVPSPDQPLRVLIHYQDATEEIVDIDNIHPAARASNISWFSPSNAIFSNEVFGCGPPYFDLPFPAHDHAHSEFWHWYTLYPDTTKPVDSITLVGIQLPADTADIHILSISYHPCCNHDGMRGDVNFDFQGPNIADLTYLVDYLFRGGPEPQCYEEGDVNGDGNINIADLTYLVDFLFRGGPPPPPCP